MKKEFTMPESYHVLSEQEMEEVSGGTMTGTVKGKRKRNTDWREFWNDFFINRKK